MKTTTASGFFPASLAMVLLLSATVSVSRAGIEMKWDEVPEAVRATLLANGGTAGQTVDRETKSHNVDGQMVYEASVKDPNGNLADIVVKQDGKLVGTKHDDASDAAGEQRAARAKQVMAGVKFSHPRAIDNPYLPLAKLQQDIIEGAEDGKKTRVERTLKPGIHKTFKVASQPVESLCMEDRIFVNGVIAEVALDYFAQDDAGTVYYLGEDVDEYDEHGKVTQHNPADDAWLTGKDTPVPGVIMPAHPKVGDKFKSEDVSDKVDESDLVVAVDETTTVPAGTFQHCVKIEEHPAGEGAEYKWYAPGVGVVRETPATGDELLISHTTR